jgi:hypothetical protein
LFPPSPSFPPSCLTPSHLLPTLSLHRFLRREGWGQDRWKEGEGGDTMDGRREGWGQDRWKEGGVGTRWKEGGREWGQDGGRGIWEEVERF